MNRLLKTKSLVLSLMFGLLLLGVGCDSDSGSGPDGGESSSSVGTDLSSSEGSSSSGGTIQDPLSSSGVIDISSSAGITSSSSTKTGSSSSSVKGTGFSSSSKVSSSSTARSSSSSAPRSSSSWRHPFNDNIVYDSIMDPRDGQIYRTLKAVVKGNPDLFVTVMAQNLNVGTMVTGGTGQNNDDVLEKYCYNDNPENCKMYGGLYQWSEAMGLPSRCNTESCADLIADTNSHQGLCPDGWRVLTRNDFNIVLNSVQDGITGVSLADMRSGLFGGTNKTGYTLLGGGGYIKLWGGFAELGKTAYWYFSSESLTAPTSGAGAAMSNTSTTLSAGTSPKINAVSLRCVKAE